MSEHHCWYVIGRTLRLALAYAIFASLVVANPASATEDTDLVAQKTAISNSHVTASVSAGAEQLIYVDPAAPSEAADLDLLAPAAGDEADGVFVLPKTGELLESVMALTRKGESIVPALIVYEKDGTFFIPIYNLAKELSFPVTFDEDILRIEGQYFGGDNFAIDVKAKTYEFAGETHPLPEEPYILRTGKKDGLDDIYVTVEVLNKIWPLDFKSDPYLLALDIATERRLPSELAAERRKRQQELEARRQRELEPLDENYVFVPNGYRLLGPQTLSLNQNINWSNQNKSLSKNAFASGRGDVLGTEARYAANFSSVGSESLDFDNFRLLLKREDFGDGKLLPFGFTSVEVGDTSLYSPELVTNGLSGSGVRITSGRRKISRHFDEVTLEGESTPGWEIEVYRDRVLIDFGNVDDLGKYRFENIPLNYGTNNIRVVLYGPQGQIEERIEEYKIGRKFLKPGEITYEVGAVYSGNEFVDIDNRNDPDAGLSKSIRIDRGYNEFITTFATFVDQSGFKDRDDQYITFGADFNAREGVGRVEVYKQIDGGEAIDVSYGNRFFGVNTSLSASIFNKFESIIAGFGDNVKSGDYTARLSKGFKTALGSLKINLSGDLTTFENDDRPTEIDLQTNQTLVNKYGTFGHSLISDYRDGDLQRMQGGLTYSKSLKKGLQASSSLNYELNPRERFTSTSFDVRYKGQEKVTASLGFNQSLEQSSERSIDFGASYAFEDFRTNLRLDWDNQDGTDFLLGASTTLGPDPETGRYKIANQFQQAPTSLTLKLFHDLNGDGVFSPGDEPVPRTRVILNNRIRSNYSDENGFIELKRAGGQGFVNVVIDKEATNYNPFLIAARKDGFATILRLVTKPHIDFPLIMSGSIDGTLTDADDFGMDNITIQLIDEYGQLAAEAKTHAGGFYSFELVRPGRYIVQVHPSHRVFVPPKTVRVASDDPFAYGVDLQVLSNQDPEQAKEAAVADDVRGNGRVAHTYQHSAATVGTEKPAVQTSGDGVQSVIRAVRIGEHSHKLRLVMDLSGPADYRITKEDNGSIMTIELPNTKWEVQSAPQLSGQGLLSSFEVYELPGGGTQIKLIGKDKLDVYYNTFLSAEADKSDRIYIDFLRAQ